MADYTFDLALDFPAGAINEGKLHAEIAASAIAEDIDEGGVAVDGNAVTVTFPNALTAGDETILHGDITGPAGGLIAAHDNTTSIYDKHMVAADPTVNDDSTKGVQFLFTWENTATRDVFCCVNPAPGAADWQKITGGGGGGGASAKEYMTHQLLTGDAASIIFGPDNTLDMNADGPYSFEGHLVWDKDGSEGNTDLQLYLNGEAVFGSYSVNLLTSGNSSVSSASYNGTGFMRISTKTGIEAEGGFFKLDLHPLPGGKVMWESRCAVRQNSGDKINWHVYTGITDTNLSNLTEVEFNGNSAISDNLKAGSIITMYKRKVEE